MAAPAGYRRGEIKLIADGQSFNFAPTIGGSYAWLLLAMLPTLYRLEVVGLSSTSYATRATTVTTRTDPRIPIVNRSVMLDVGGPTDIINGNSAATVLAAAESYADGRRAAGVDYVIGYTVTPGTIPTWYSSAQDAVRLSYNASLKSSSHFDAVVDMAALAHAADPANTTYFSDGLHPTAALATEIATLTRTAMAALGLPT